MKTIIALLLTAILMSTAVLMIEAEEAEKPFEEGEKESFSKSNLEEEGHGIEANEVPVPSISVCINEFLADPASDWDGSGVADSADEWIELYNPGDSVIDLYGWNVSDPSKSYSLSGLSVEPKGFLLIYKKDSGISLNNGGDSIYLKNELDETVDSFDYYSSRDDVSMGRRPDGSSTWTSLFSPSLNASNGPAPRVVFNEVMYDPVGADTHLEWVELYNNGTDVNVTEWIFSTQDSDEYYFPEFLFPGQSYLVLSTDTEEDDLDLSDGVGSLYMDFDSAILTNTGDDLLLMDIERNPIDYISYGESHTIDECPVELAWDGTFYNSSSEAYEGNVPNPSAIDEGDSISLITNGLDIDSPLGWSCCPERNVTKGRNNSKIFNFELEAEFEFMEFEEGEKKELTLWVNNSGSMPDVYDIELSFENDNWSASLEFEEVSILSSGSRPIKLNITAPDSITSGNVLDITVKCTSRGLSVLNFSKSIECVIPAVDLTISELQIEVNEKEFAQCVQEGEVVKVTATVSNLGEISAATFNVSFSINDEVFSRKQYGYCHPEYSKHPSVWIDTLDLVGNNTVAVEVDVDNEIYEISESNNRMNFSLNVSSTEPQLDEKKLLITEVYYHCRNGMNNEFITIENPNDLPMNISGWSITDGEGELFFPENTIIGPEGSLRVCRNPQELFDEAGWVCDLSYGEEEVSMDVPLMVVDSIPYLSNSGDEVYLRTEFRHIIDCVVWGNSEYEGPGWIGCPVENIGKGKLLKRGTNIDSNSCQDWGKLFAPGIGQTEFEVLSSIADVETLVLPEGGYNTISKAVKEAKKDILISAYTFSDLDLADEICSALGRGVNVSVLLEGEPVGGWPSNQILVLNKMLGAGAEIRLMKKNETFGTSPRYQLMNAKYMVVDSQRVSISTEGPTHFGLAQKDELANRGWGVVIRSIEIAERLTQVFNIDSDPIHSDIEIYNGSRKTGEILDETPSYYSSNFPGFEKYENQSIEVLLGPDNLLEMLLQNIQDAKKEIAIEMNDMDLVWDSGVVNPIITALFEKAAMGVNVSLLLDGSYADRVFSPVFEKTSMDLLNLTKPTALDIVGYINSYARENGIIGLEARACYPNGLNSIHTKGMVIDEVDAFILSGNWNEQTLTENREIGIKLSGRGAEHFLAAFDLDWKRSPSIKDPPGSLPPELLITQVYYDTNNIYDSNEFFSIKNVGNCPVDLWGCYFTDQNSNQTSYEATGVFPLGSVIEPGETIHITKTGSTFFDVMGFDPDYVHGYLNPIGWKTVDILGGEMMLANDGDELMLHDRYHRTIDVVCWGDSKYCFEGWVGKPAKDISEGLILIRNSVGGAYVDTDSASDWEGIRQYRPGQTNLEVESFDVDGNVTTFTSPDSSFETLDSWLSSAQNSIFVNVYQFHNIYLMDRLVNMSTQGLDVKVLVDGDPVGGLTDAGRYVGQKLSEAGAEVYYWINDPGEHIYKRYRYDHAKYAILDNSSVAVMSENWKTTGLPIDPTYGNRGWGIIVEDPELAGYFTDVFFADISADRNDTIPYDPLSEKYGPAPEDFQPPDDIRTGAYYPRSEGSKVRSPCRVTPIISPDTSLTEYTILGAINSATDEILIEQLSIDLSWNYDEKVEFDWNNSEGYYIDFENETSYNLYICSVINAARSGVGVRILIDGSFEYFDGGNSQVVEYINSIARLENLNLSAALVNCDHTCGKADLEIVHNKGMIIDREVTLISSINWVLGSVGRNREAGLLVENAEIAAYYKTFFDLDWGMSNYQDLTARCLYSEEHTAENGTDTTYPIRIENSGSEGLEIIFEIVWADDIVSSDTPSGYDGKLDVGSISLLSNSTADVLVTIDTPEVENVEEHTIGLRVWVDGYPLDLVFFKLTVKNLTGQPRNETPEKDDPAKEKKSYTVPVVLAIIILVLAIIVVALIRDKMKWKGEGSEGEEEEEMVEEEEGMVEELEEEGEGEMEEIEEELEDDEVEKDGEEEEIIDVEKELEDRTTEECL